MQSGKMDHTLFESNHRPFDDMVGLVNAVKRTQSSWCWGSNNWIKMNDYCLRWTVQGALFKGHIYLVVNGSDLFDIYFCSNRGNIKHTAQDVYVDVLVETIDSIVERAPQHA